VEGGQVKRTCTRIVLTRAIGWIAVHSIGELRVSVDEGVFKLLRGIEACREISFCVAGLRCRRSVSSPESYLSGSPVYLSTEDLLRIEHTQGCESIIVQVPAERV
jgi:hypothetical protein